MKAAVFLLVVAAAVGGLAQGGESSASRSGQPKKADPSNQRPTIEINKYPTAGVGASDKEKGESAPQKLTPSPSLGGKVLRWIKGWIGTPAGVSAIFTGLAAIFIGLQIRTTRAVERSWVFANKIVGSEPGHWKFNPDNIVPECVLVFKVVGKTIVTLTRTRAILRSLPAKSGVQPPEPELSGLAESEMWDSNIFHNRALPPEANFEMRLRLKPKLWMTEEEWGDIRDGRAFLCANVIVEYRDAFGKDRKTSLLHAYRLQRGFVQKDASGTVLNPSEFVPIGPAGSNSAT